MTVSLRPGINEGGLPMWGKRITNCILIGVPLIGSIVAIIHAARFGLRWSDVAAFLIFYVWCGLGAALGFHRLFSHNSFKAHPALAFGLCAGGTMCFQGSPLRWVLDHRRHHALADIAGDVHSPHISPDGRRYGSLAGFWHAHMGWMFDRWTTDEAIFGKGLREDPCIHFFTRTHGLWLGASLALPWLFGWIAGGKDAAWSAMLFGGCLRTTVLHQVVWSVNSFGHLVGQRNHATLDKSTDNAWLAILTFGDGWHNGHHSAPRSSRHGLAPGQTDTNAQIIEWLAHAGLAQNRIFSRRQE